MTKSSDNKLSIALRQEGDILYLTADAGRLGQATAHRAAPTAEAIEKTELLLAIGPSKDVLREVGETLYGVLSHGDVGKLLGECLPASAAGSPNAEGDHRSVEIELCFGEDQTDLCKYPWECIRDRHGRFLVQAGLADMTRTILYPQKAPAWDEDPLRGGILQVISQPSDLSPIVANTLALHGAMRLEHASFDDFRTAVLTHSPDVSCVQFDGHGALLRCCKCGEHNAMNWLKCSACGAELGSRNGTAFLMFERGAKREPIEVEVLGAVLSRSKVRFACLLACETARLDGKLVFTGYSPGLILSGVPAVLGMQYPITNDFAQVFSTALFGALRDGHGLGKAVAKARTATVDKTWFTPALYTRFAPPPDRLRILQQSRAVETAAPSEVSAGKAFVALLRMRRADSPSLTPSALRKHLGLAVEAKLIEASEDAHVRLEAPATGELLQGEVTVRLAADGCDVDPPECRIVVSENLDGPTALFRITPQRTGTLLLIFRLFQRDRQVAALSFPIVSTDPGVVGRAVLVARRILRFVSGERAAQLQREELELKALLQESNTRVQDLEFSRRRFRSTLDEANRVLETNKWGRDTDRLMPDADSMEFRRAEAARAREFIRGLSRVLKSREVSSRNQDELAMLERSLEEVAERAPTREQLFRWHRELAYVLYRIADDIGESALKAAFESLVESHVPHWPFGWPFACVRCGFPFDYPHRWRHWFLLGEWRHRHRDLQECPRCGAHMMWRPWPGGDVLSTLIVASRELGRSCDETADALRRFLVAADQASGGMDTGRTEAARAELRAIENYSELARRTYRACEDVFEHGGVAMDSLRSTLSELVRLVR